MAVWRVVCSGLLYGTEPWANVFHINPAGAFNHAEVLDAFENAYTQDAAGGGMAFLKPCKGQAVAGEAIGVTLTAMSLQAVVTPAPPEIRTMNHMGGQNTAGGMPLEVALVISWKTAFAGRSYRGRTFLPPFHENQNDDSGGTLPHPASATVNALAVNAEKLLSDLVTANAVLCVYSRTLAAANTITGGYIDFEWDTQRRRASKTGSARVLFP